MPNFHAPRRSVALNHLTPSMPGTVLVTWFHARHACQPTGGQIDQSTYPLLLHQEQCQARLSGVMKVQENPET